MVLIAILTSACVGGGVPAGTATPAPSSAGAIGGPAAAFAAVRAVTPLFADVAQRDPALIGQATWWQAEATDGGWLVTVEAGWGDCQAGCIDRHDWTWTVASDGNVTFGGETGSALTSELVSGLAAASTATGLGGRALGGPTCPVERPGDPACAPRLVAGATLVVRGADGTEVARLVTDASGLFRFDLPAGDYTLEAGAVDGFMRAPGVQSFTVVDGTQTWLDAQYDTGIR